MHQYKNILIHRCGSTALMLLITLHLFAVDAFAMREPRPLAIDGRLKTLTYHPHQFYKFTGYFFFQTIIELEAGETVNTITVGNPSAWSVRPAGNRIFIKPVSLTPEDAMTNMTVITNRRMYFFELHADEVEDMTSQDIPFVISFLYPEIGNSAKVQRVSAKTVTTRLANKALNYDYTLSGDQDIAPLQIFDDGLFTYFKFPQNSPMPAIFEVGTDGYEGLVNFRIEGIEDDEYVVVEAILSQFTLRYGDLAVCVFNERKPLKLKTPEKKGLFSSTD